MLGVEETFVEFTVVVAEVVLDFLAVDVLLVVALVVLEVGCVVDSLASLVEISVLPNLFSMILTLPFFEVSKFKIGPPVFL